MKSYFMIVLLICGFVCEHTLANSQTYPLHNKAYLNISLSGKDTNGVPLYSMQANNADITKVLSAIFTKSGDQFLIDQDVRGAISFSLKKMPLMEILHFVEIAAKPPIHVERGTIVHVTSEMALPRTISEGIAGGIGGALGGHGGTMGKPLHSIPLAALNRDMVNLDIPQNRPITLQQALQTIQEQSDIPISMSNEIPRNVQFSGQITNTPVNVALDAIAKTAGLKVVPLHNGGLLLTSGNNFRLFIDKVLIGSYPNHPLLFCTKCHYPLSPDWVVCPNCGQITPHGYELLEKANSKNRQGGDQPNR